MTRGRLGVSDRRLTGCAPAALFYGTALRTSAARLICAALLITTVLLISAALLPLAGCGLDLNYLLPAAAGQLDIILHTVPVEQAIAGGTLTDEQIRKLQLVADAREFARDRIGLSAGTHYTRFYDAGDEPVAFNVSASRKDRFEPFIWTFPLVGSVPYLGFFDRDAALAERDELRSTGYDVFIYEIDAYYALGFFSNPILSPMLNRPDEDLIDTVIHELTHATIYRSGDTDFNESLATFVGRTGAIQFLDERFADEPQRKSDALARFADIDTFSDFLLGVYNDLDAYYRSDLPSDAKITGREDLYQAARDRFAAEIQGQLNNPDDYAWVANLPTNNAYMLGVRRYHLDLDAFADVLAAAGGDWAVALEVYRAAASADDSYAYLRAWATGDVSAQAKMLAHQQPVAAPVGGEIHTCALRRATTFVPSR